MSVTDWDVVIVGAGPAGAVAARQISSAGAKVLLIDKSEFPRSKVCGCCLNRNAINSLHSAGISDLLSSCGAVDVNSYEIFHGDSRAELSLPGGAILSRHAFDTALIHEAIANGSQFLPSTAGVSTEIVDDRRTLKVRQSSSRKEREAGRGENSSQVDGVHVDGQHTAIAKILIVADGLAGNLLKKSDSTAGSSGIPATDVSNVVVHPNSRVGVGATLSCESHFYRRGRIYMAVQPAGYLGIVRTENDELDIAAAFDVEALRLAGSPAALAIKTLESCQMPIPIGISACHWRGTPALTRRRQAVADQRLFVIGDAAGYVEPFTGEGMAWAIASGSDVAPIALSAVGSWTPDLPDQWRRLHRKRIMKRQFTCRILGRVLRNNLATRIMIASIRKFPQLAIPVVRSLNQ